MTIDEKIMLMEARMVRLAGRGDKNTKSPGVRRKLERQLRRAYGEKKR